MLDLRNLNLRYLIGTDNPGKGSASELTVVSYNVTHPCAHGVSGKYLNLYDEERSGAYGPYLPDTDTAHEYGERVPDPRGKGFWRNVQDQIARAKQQGFVLIGDVDNRDAYRNYTVLDVYTRIAHEGMQVICKNPGVSDHDESSVPLLKHPAVVGAIVEHGEIDSHAMHRMREEAGKPDLPVWFVAFGSRGQKWCMAVAKTIQRTNYRHMGVSFSPRGEYSTSETILILHRDAPS